MNVYGGGEGLCVVGKKLIFLPLAQLISIGDMHYVISYFSTVCVLMNGVHYFLCLNFPKCKVDVKIHAVLESLKEGTSVFHAATGNGVGGMLFGLLQ